MAYKIKNITSNIAPEKTIMELEKILAMFGVTKTLKEYEKGNIIGLSFCLSAPDGSDVAIKLPMKIEKARAIVESAVEDGRLSRKFLEEPYRTEKALIVGWRIIKDIVHSQLSFILIGFANPIEIFLAYVYDPKSDKTVYERLMSEGFKALEHKET